MASWGPPWRALWPLGAVLGRSWGLLEHLGSHLEPSGAILSRLGGHPGLSEALLEPAWAILDALTARDRPRPGPGEGARGRGKPLPEGEEGGWKRKLPKPLTPRGLVGFEDQAWLSQTEFAHGRSHQAPQTTTSVSQKGALKGARERAEARPLARRPLARRTARPEDRSPGDRSPGKPLARRTVRQ